MGAAMAAACGSCDRCRRSGSSPPWTLDDSRLNDDVRQIVAEFACDSVLLALRLQSSRWHAAVAAAISEVGAVTTTRAILSPQIVVDAPKDAAASDSLVRASMALVHHRDAVDFSVFPHLRSVDMTLLFDSIRRLVEDDGTRTRTVVNLSTVSEQTTLPVTILGTKSAVGTLILPPKMEIPLRNVNRCVLHRLDLSHMLLDVLPRNFVYSANLQELVLPSSVSALEQDSFSGLTIPRLDLSQLTRVTYLPRNCLNGAHVQELLLPPTVQALGEFCFSGLTIARLDLSPLTGLSDLPRNCFNSAKLQDLLLPPTVNALDQFTFSGLTLPVLNLSQLTGLRLLSRNFLHSANLEELVLPASVNALCQFCFCGLTLTRLDLSDLHELEVLPSNCFHGAKLKRLLVPSTVTVLEDNCFSNLVIPRLDLSHLVGLTMLPPNCLNGATVRELLLPAGVAPPSGVACKVVSSAGCSRDDADIA